MNRSFRAKIVSNIPLSDTNYLLTIEPVESVIEPSPGQFYMIGLRNTYDPLLRRPFSYFRRTAETIQFLYAVRGKGTSVMRTFDPGEILDIVGPLGKGYPDPINGNTPLLAAGGIGIASLFPLSERFARKACVLYGARCKDDLLALNHLEQLGNQLIVCTDDCSFGKAGNVGEILEDFLTSRVRTEASYTIYACGPRPMLKAVAKIAVDRGIKGYTSLEENMACGVGACWVCTVKTIDGYKRVCKEGPVFPIEEIVW